MNKQLNELRYECVKILAFAVNFEKARERAVYRNGLGINFINKPIATKKYKSVYNFGNGLTDKLNKCNFISQYKTYSELKKTLSLFNDGNALNGLDDDYCPHYDYQQLCKLFTNCIAMINFIDILETGKTIYD
jgi:hypothetical protein